MTEIIINIFQLMVSGGCSSLALRRAHRAEQKEWMLLGFFYLGFFLGDLYWLLYLSVYGITPRYSYISELSWYAAYLFLLMLLRLRSGGLRGYRCPAAWTGPVFAAAMCLFYMQWGDYVGNLIVMLLMGLLLRHSIRGLLYCRDHLQRQCDNRYLFAAVLIFCLLEYSLWTLSCFWMGDTPANPYFWCDILLTLNFVLLFLVVDRMVGI